MRLAKAVKSGFELERWVTSKLCEAIDTPRALTVFLLLKYKEWDQLLELETDPSDYLDAESFRDDRLVRSVLKSPP